MPDRADEGGSIAGLLWFSHSPFRHWAQADRGTWLEKTFRMTSKIFHPCLRAVEIKPRIRANSCAPWLERNPPDILCLHFIIRKSRSERLLVNGPVGS